LSIPSADQCSGGYKDGGALGDQRQQVHGDHPTTNTDRHRPLSSTLQDEM